MQLKPLYIVRFNYPDGWDVQLKNPSEPKSTTTEEEHFYFANGKVKGRINGEFHGSNHPHRRVDKTFVMKIEGFIKTDDGASIMLQYRGYGRSYPKGRRQVVGAPWHVTDNENYQWLNDTVSAISGEVRVPTNIPPDKLKQADVQLVFEVSEIIWQAPGCLIENPVLIDQFATDIQ